MDDKEELALKGPLAATGKSAPNLLIRSRALLSPFSISNPKDRVLFIERTLVFGCQHGLALLRGGRQRGSFGK